MATKKRALPSELEGVAYAEDVTAIQERVDKCYSTERYEEFQGTVEKIIGRYMKSVLGWSLLVWVASLIGSMFLQKVFSIF